MNRKCKTNPNKFCYICGRYLMAKESVSISAQTTELYFKYFGVRLGDQNKSWALKVTCKSCPEMLRQWEVGKLKSLPSEYLWYGENQ